MCYLFEPISKLEKCGTCCLNWLFKFTGWITVNGTLKPPKTLPSKILNLALVSLTSTNFTPSPQILFTRWISQMPAKHIYYYLNERYVPRNMENINNCLDSQIRQRYFCSRKNFKSLFSVGMVLVVGVSNLYISSSENDWCHSAQVTSQGNIKGRANHSRPLFASSLASSRTDQPTWESTFPLLHWLFFTDSLSHISSWAVHPFPLSPQSSPLRIMRRAHPTYGPLVSVKSFFHH